MFLFRKAATLPSAAEALPGRTTATPIAERHLVNGQSLTAAPAGSETIYLGLGCFWGAERLFWQAGPGVVVTAVGYQGGETPNPTYEEVCSGRTGHAEVVKVVYDPKVTSLGQILKIFWEAHDPTQGMRQGNDVGTQYRSTIYTTTPGQLQEVEASKTAYERALAAKGLGPITTEIRAARPSIMPRTITSNIWPRTRAAIAVWRGPGSVAPSGLESPRRRLRMAAHGEGEG